MSMSKFTKNKSMLTLVDFYSFYYRNINPKVLMKLSYDNMITGGLFNLIRSYYKILKEFPNSLFIMDNAINNRRKTIHNEYKANRDKSKFEIVKKGVDIYKWRDEFLQSLPYYYISYVNQEADDLIASIIHSVKLNQLPFEGAIIISLDSDLLQLVDNKKVFYVNLRDDWKLYTPEKLFEKFGLTDYRNIVYYKVLFGDISDNISPSVKKGIRKKLILDYLNDKGYDYISNLSIEELVDQINALYKSPIIDNISIVKSNFELIKLKPILGNEINYKDLVKYNKGDEILYNQLLEKYNFTHVPSFKDIITLINERNSLLKLQSEKIDFDEIL